MSGTDGVRALPGGIGAELADLVDKVDTANPGAITAIATRWQTASEDVVHPFTTLGGPVSRVDAVWKGESADAFVSYFAKYGEAATTLRGGLNSAGSTLSTLAATITSAKTELESICSQAVQAVEKERTGQSMDPTKRVNAMKAAIQPFVDKAEPIVAKVQSALDAAHGAISKNVSQVGPTFSNIPPADTQTFLPGSGHKLDWTKVTGTELASALPDGKAGSNGGSDGGGRYSGSGGSGGGGPFGGYGPSGPPPATQPTGKVADWVDEAMKILNGPPYNMNLTDKDRAIINRIIQHESGGNPNAINNWDSNAKAGHPSKGLMQTIDGTFSTYSIPGHKQIYNPVDNIIAAVRYAVHRYHSLSGVPVTGGY
jgi:uncharacterized protein YukE